MNSSSDGSGSSVNDSISESRSGGSITLSSQPMLTTYEMRIIEQIDARNEKVRKDISERQAIEMSRIAQEELRGTMKSECPICGQVHGDPLAGPVIELLESRVVSEGFVPSVQHVSEEYWASAPIAPVAEEEPKPIKFREFL